MVARYTHGVGVDDHLIMERDEDLTGILETDEAYFYHTDGMGSIVDITNNVGAITNSYVYDSFGNIVLQQGSLENPYTYTGREYDPESGLMYYRERYLDTLTGRFLQEDPIGLEDGMNLYTYVDSVGKPTAINPNNFTNLYNFVGNNPINRIDPLGLWYIDVNLSYISPVGGGGTAGVMIGTGGIYKYGGGALGIPGPGASFTFSTTNPSEGYASGGQVGTPWFVGGQTGVDENANTFWELGLVTPGASGSWFYVENIWKWPWEKDKKEPCEKK